VPEFVEEDSIMWMYQNMSFQKGNQLAAGKGKHGPLKRDLTIELSSQLNELLESKTPDGETRTKLHRVVRNLITQATTGADVVDENGNVVVEGAGDLAAIQEIFNRFEGKPS
jgi:hypothetical protein